MFGLLAVSATLSPAELSTATSVDVAQGASTVVTVTVDQKSDRISGVQLDIEWDDSAVIVSVALADGVRALGKNLHSAPLSDNSMRCLITGGTAGTITKQPLIRILVLARRDAVPGEYPLKLVRVFATDQTGRKLPLKGTAIRINIKVTGTRTGRLPDRDTGWRPSSLTTPPPQQRQQLVARCDPARCV